MSTNAVTTLIDAQRIRARVRELGEQITADYAGQQLIMAAVLHGALVFAADLMRATHLDVTLDIVMASSYDGTRSSGTVKHLIGPYNGAAGHPVLLIDDILDTGLTLARVRDRFLEKGATDVSACVLLDKPARRTQAITAKYVGFEIDDLFVVGYGLDYNGRYRNLPYIGALPAEELA